MTKEINLEPLEPLRPRDWVDVPASDEVKDYAKGLPIACYYHQNTELTVMSSVEVNEATHLVEHVLQISRAGTRQASDREVNFVLTNFGATGFEIRERRGPSRVFARVIDTGGRPVDVRIAH